jgi:hypothetical protein
MDLSIVILNYKSAGLTKQCVKTLMLCRPDLEHEIIVVDNDSRDGVEAALKSRFPSVRFIQTGANLGFAAGNNAGIRASRGRYVLILNPDITVRPGAIEAMFRHMEGNRDIGIMGPRLLKPDGSVDESCYAYPRPITPVARRTPLGRTGLGRREVGRYLMDGYDRRSTREVDWLLGAVLMVRREAIDRVGLFDERYFLYFEDTDWCRRFRSSGWRVVYFAGSEMVHLHERLSAGSPWYLAPLNKAARIHLSSCVKYFLKWRGEKVEA